MGKIQNKSFKLSVKLDVKETSSALISAGKTFFSNIGNGKSLIAAGCAAIPDILKIVGVDLKKTVGAQAFSAYTAAFLTSVYELLAEQNMKPQELKIPKKSNLKNSYNFEDFSEKYPTDLPLYKDLREEFHQILVEQDISEETATDIVNSVRSKFPNNLKEIISENDDFNAFYKYYQISDCTDLESVFEKQKIFCVNEFFKPLSIDSDLTLEKIYVTPACRYKFSEKSKNDDGKKKEKEDKGEFKENLLDEVKQIVQQTNQPTNRIIFIKGQPGHGKTSFVKYFLKEMAECKSINDPEYILLYLPLSKLASKLEHGIFKAIAEQIGLTDFHESYLKDRDIILVLDGLDEILIANTDYQKHIEREIGKLNEFIADKPRFKLIITTRSQCFDTHKSAFPLNYYLFEILDFTENKDGEKVLTEKVNLWIKKYKQLK
ncbi:NACHT domain-containing protein, partial [bacterium]|nr:NACHT domain-containing protein [bacterium]